MARVTEEYIRKAFYRQFYAMSRERQEGVIEALQTVYECAQQSLPLEEPDEKETDGTAK